MNPELNVLMQDEHLVAVYKPSGLLVHRSNIDRRETQFALQILRDQLGARVFPVHRLDKPTAGVLLFAKNADVGVKLNEAFAHGAVDKTYLAIVRGIPNEHGIIDHPLKKIVDRFDASTAAGENLAKEAQTQYRVVSSVELPIKNKRYGSSRYSLVELKPHTGRRHQLRRHLKHLFHPIIGDTTYGDGTHNLIFRKHFNVHRLLLVATCLRFCHPVTGEMVCVGAEPDEQFAQLLKTVALRTDPVCWG